MKTQTADEADARFLANIGVVLAAGTLAIGVVLVSSLPPSQNNMVAEITLPAVMTVADMQPISPLFDYQDHSGLIGAVVGAVVILTVWGLIAKNRVV